MPSPFPGMDPYIERPAIWADFHDSLIACIRGVLQPLLRPRYAALSQRRLFVVESDRPIYPDVSVLRAPPPPLPGGAAATLEADGPAVFELWREERRQPYLTIIDPADRNRVITAIEVLSPDNKAAGPGRTSYLQKRDEFWNSGTNLVEIDLLREGASTVRVDPERLEGLRPWHFLVAVTRNWPPRQEVYAVPLARRLPRVAVPLTSEDRDVTLDLQAAFTRCYDEGPYPGFLHYHEAPPGALPPDEVNWCAEVLRAAGLRPTNGA